ncbi:hypothetical protein NUW54_g13418 [Trametes sanguinea]|uniref:Uncharacterized protein n=1 Tax=Trametes sanguinea TaxID=158606 RepID=A0ACC1MMK0_9APHY|nr:hypothetical protein NUW54_g13418 [Trametes sanguinea]
MASMDSEGWREREEEEEERLMKQIKRNHLTKSTLALLSPSVASPRPLAFSPSTPGFVSSSPPSSSLLLLSLIRACSYLPPLSPNSRQAEDVSVCSAEFCCALSSHSPPSPSPPPAPPRSLQPPPSNNRHHRLRTLLLRSIPSPPPSTPNVYDISPHLGTPYDSFDIPLPDTASHFPHTPSYNGSYQNSPYSNYSDLPPIDGSDEALGLLVDNPSGISITSEYDPADYEVPSSGGPLILDEHFMNGTHVSVSLTPPMNDYTSPNAFDHASPASSNGAEEDGQPVVSLPCLALGLPAGRSSLAPANKPQSPPQLVIPDTTSPGGAGVDSPPIINAPDGDGGLIGSGPTLQIVPATPVSGGGVTPQAAPFRDTLGSMQSGKPRSLLL